MAYSSERFHHLLACGCTKVNDDIDCQEALCDYHGTIQVTL